MRRVIVGGRNLKRTFVLTLPFSNPRDKGRFTGSLMTHGASEPVSILTTCDYIVPEMSQVVKSVVLCNDFTRLVVFSGQFAVMRASNPVRGDKAPLNGPSLPVRPPVVVDDVRVEGVGGRGLQRPPP